MPRPPAPPPKAASDAAAKDGTQTLWLLKDGQPLAVKVSVLGTNGQVSEVRPVDEDAALTPGAEVITEALAAKK